MRVRRVQPRQKFKAEAGAVPSRGTGPQKAVPVAYKGSPTMSKTDRDLLLFAAKWRDALAVFEEATLGARRGIARKIAHDLCAEVHFAGEIYVPPPISLMGTSREDDR